MVGRVSVRHVAAGCWALDLVRRCRDALGRHDSSYLKAERNKRGQRQRTEGTETGAGDWKEKEGIEKENGAKSGWGEGKRERESSVSAGGQIDGHTPPKHG